MKLENLINNTYWLRWGKRSLLIIDLGSEYKETVINLSPSLKENRQVLEKIKEVISADKLTIKEFDALVIMPWYIPSDQPMSIEDALGALERFCYDAYEIAKPRGGTFGKKIFGIGARGGLDLGAENPVAWLQVVPTN